LSRVASNTVEQDTNVREDDENTLVAGSLRGDSEAFSQLVSRYQDRVYNVAFRICRDHQQAEDVTQEAFLKAFKKLDRFRGKSRFYTWLFRIAVNQALSWKRKHAGRHVLFLDSGTCDCDNPGESSPAAMVTSNEDGSGKSLENSETAMRIANAIVQLDDELRPAIVLRDVDDMSYAEIARILGVPDGTVKSRIYRGRKILQEKLSDLME